MFVNKLISDFVFEFLRMENISNSTAGSQNSKCPNLTIEKYRIIKNMYKGIRVRDQIVSVRDAIEMCNSLTKVFLSSEIKSVKSIQLRNGK